jgi:Zn-dependent protease with chaperone function
MRRSGSALLLAVALALAGANPAVAREPDEGVSVGRGSIVRHAYPASLIENSAQKQFIALKQQANQKGALLPPNHPQNLRLRRIARDMLPFAEKWNARAKDWKWEVVTIQSNNITAFCMPGGKIAFFTGIIERLQLNDDEIAMVMGHEMAHALREHARARAVKSTLTNLTGRVVGSLIFGQAGEALGAGAANLFTLRFSRGDETDADLVGMELAARAGYDPASGVGLWEKMGAASKGAPPQWLSTHPANETRVKTIRDHLPEVTPLYERARAAKAAGGRPPSERPNDAPAQRQPSARPAPPQAPGGVFPQQVPLPVPR